uniref:Uncharacterized protein n=1 Tax=Setaria viridis TaxID=4556 RepID=A0A4U6T9I0_SETVI|nr:hypothetical protein SEVIR_9G465501v2 [Setaria viridis]
MHIGMRYRFGEQHRIGFVGRQSNSTLRVDGCCRAAEKRSRSRSIPPRPLSPSSQVRLGLTLPPVINSPGIPHAPTRLPSSTALFLLTHPPQPEQQRSAPSIHGVLRRREVEVLQEEPEQRQPARPGGRGRRRGPFPEAVVQHEGRRPGDRPARERRRRRGGGRVRCAAAFVLEPVRGAGQGAAGALLHHAPLRHHARLLEGLLVAANGGSPAGRRRSSIPAPPPSPPPPPPPPAVSPPRSESHGGRIKARDAGKEAD